MSQTFSKFWKRNPNSQDQDHRQCKSTVAIRQNFQSFKRNFIARVGVRPGL